jgi:hypothetical protein
VLSVAAGPAAKEPDRLRSIASDITAAVHASDQTVFEGDGGKLATALMLVAIAKHESEFHAKVDDCTRRGDTGRSITIFQILRGPNWGGHDDRTICGDRKLATRLALGLLARPLAKRARLTPQMLANAYATGAPGNGNQAAKDICKVWEQLARGAGLEKASCGAARSFAAPRPPAAPVDGDARHAPHRSTPGT